MSGGVLARFEDVLTILRTAFSNWSDDHAPRLAAALSYATVFSIAPLLLIATGIAGVVMGADAARHQILQQAADILGRQGAAAVEALMGGSKAPQSGLVATLIGVITLLVGAVGVVAQLKDALNSVWDVKAPETPTWRDFVRQYIANFALVVATGFLLLVSLLVTAFIGATTAMMRTWLPDVAWMWLSIDTAIGIVMATVIFALIFKTVPDTRVEWREVGLGAFVTAVLFTAGRIALGWYLGRASGDSAYQATGAVLALLAWVYYSAQLVLFGAEFTYAYAHRERDHTRPSPSLQPAHVVH